MATLIPDLISAKASPGEQLIFRRLRDEPGTEGWFVFHSLDVAKHRSQVMGEIDFVIVAPGLGWVCLEVKSCESVRIDEGGLWYLGRRNPERRGPFKQASEAMWSLHAWLLKRAPVLGHVPFQSAVAFTHCAFPVSSPEWHDWQVIDKPALGRRGGTVGTFIRTLLEKHRATLRPLPQFRVLEGVPSEAEVAVIRQNLRPEVEFYVSPRARTADIDERVRHYTERQFVTIDRLVRNRRVLVDGPAGSGKTMLALEIARRASLGGLGRLDIEKPRVLFTCFNRLLGQTLKSSTAGLAGVTCMTVSQYMMRICDRDAPDADEAFWRQTLPAETAHHLVETSPPGGLYDVLVIDEAQDLTGDAVLDVLDLSVRGGLKNGCWYAFGDYERQALYSWNNERDAVEEATQAKHRLIEGCGGFDYPLRENCRNPNRVAGAVELLGGLSPGYDVVLRENEDGEFDVEYYRDAAHQKELLSDALTNAARWCSADGNRGPVASC